MQERFGQGATIYGPYGGAGGWAAYNPPRNNTRAGAPPMDHTVHDF
jgi:hypothetical protein